MFERNTLCNCGSGKNIRDLVDAAGVFCCFVCDDCEKEKKVRFNPIIFQRGDYPDILGERLDDDCAPLPKDG